MEQINELVFYKLQKLPIVSQRDALRLYVDDNKEFVVKLLKKKFQGTGKDQKHNQIKREIELAYKLIDKKNSFKYVIQNYKVFETNENYFIMMEKCDGSLDDLFRSNDIVNIDLQARIGLIVELFYQIIQGYKYIKSIYPDFIHRDLCLDNILYKKINGCYIAKIADFGIAQLEKGNITFDFNNKIEYMPPEQKTGKEQGIGNYDDKLDVYTLGVCLYKMLFGTYVQYTQQKLNIPNYSKYDGYLRIISLLNKMLEIDQSKRMCWQELYSLLYQFPQILSQKCQIEEKVTDCINFLTERIEIKPICQLLDPQIIELALQFNQLFITKNLNGQQQFMIINIMKYTFQQMFNQYVLEDVSLEQFDDKILKIRTAKYIADLAEQIMQVYFQRDQSFQTFVIDNNQQQNALKTINQPPILQQYFHSFIKNRLQQDHCIIF